MSALDEIEDIQFCDNNHHEATEAKKEVLRIVNKLQTQTSNLEETLRKLSNAITDYDTDKECIFCSKEQWGAEYHDEKCPMRMAYVVLNNQDGRE